MADSPITADDLVPLVPLVEEGYPRNFIRQAVCELRFPTLMSLGASRPPEKFIAALRKRFPLTESANEVTLSASESELSGHVHILKSTKGTWSVTLKQSSVALEAFRYTTYAEFRARAHEVLAAALLVIDSDYFTRIGLRYINVIQTDASPMLEWINPVLSGALHGQGFRSFSEFAGKFALSTEDGGCTLQHGIRLKSTSQLPGPTSDPPDYVIDIDTFRNEVTDADAMTALDTMHRQAFSLFSWAIGEKAREKLTALK